MNIDEKEANILLALLEFGKNFSQYVKEMDPNLWENGIDFAKDYTKIDGVELEYVDDPFNPPIEPKE